MRAAVMYSPGDIRLEDVAEAERRPGGEVLLRVAAVGVCGSDIPRMLTKGAHRMPIVCGHEFSGPHRRDRARASRVRDGRARRRRAAHSLPRLRPVRDRQFLALPRLRLFRQPPRRRLYRVRRRARSATSSRRPKGTDPRAVAMTDPASIALHAMWKAPPTHGRARRRHRLRPDRPLRHPVDEADGLHRGRRDRRLRGEARPGARGRGDAHLPVDARCRRRTSSAI